MRNWKKSKILENIKIQKIWYQWVWISTRDDGKKIIIKWWVLPDSIVDCRILRTKKDYIECQVITIKQLPSWLNLNEDLCPHYFFNPSQEASCKRWCWWCKWQILPYPKQLELKQAIVEDSFRNLKDIIEKVGIQQIIPSPKIDWYRNKIEFSFGKYISQKQELFEDWQLWFHKQWEFSKIVDIDNCRFISSKSNDLFIYLKNLLKESWLPTYDQKTHIGFLRHLVIREWFNTSQILVNLSVADKNLDSKTQKIWDKIKDNLSKDSYLKENITTFIITYNNDLSDVVQWRNITTQILWWEWFIFEKLIFNDFDWEEINFRISEFSFFQTNTYWAQTLFSTAAKILWKQDWLLLDLYCGTWSIWLSFIKIWLADQVIWIEILPQAIDDAKYNAKINWLSDNSYFVAGKAENLVFQDENIQEKILEIKTIIVDPPRDWLHKDVVKFLIDLKKKIDFKLLYISCNPITMSRDLKMFVENWFDVKKLQPVDLFPNTNHVEMIGMLK